MIHFDWYLGYNMEISTSNCINVLSLKSFLASETKCDVIINFNILISSNLLSSDVYFSEIHLQEFQIIFDVYINAII